MNRQQRRAMKSRRCRRTYPKNGKKNAMPSQCGLVTAAFPKDGTMKSAVPSWNGSVTTATLRGVMREMERQGYFERFIGPNGKLWARRTDKLYEPGTYKDQEKLS